MRVRSWISGSALGSVLGLTAVILPAVSVPPPPVPPVVEVHATDLTGASQTVHRGWKATADAPADLVSVTWKGDTEAEFTLEARDEQGRWRFAGTVGSEQDHEGPDLHTTEYARARATVPGNVSEPLWVGDATAVRVRLAEGTARDVDVSRVETQDPVQRENVAGAAMVNQPWIITRPQWGANEGLRLANCPEGPSYGGNVQLAVVHHTAGSNNYGPADSPAIVRGLYAYATQTLRYCDTHYNFFIDRYGQIFEGRFGGMDKPVTAAHATGANTNTVGIALIGNFDETGVPAAARESLKQLLNWKFAWHGVDPLSTVYYTTISGTDRWPAGSTHALPAVVGHRDPGITGCPGRYLYPMLDGIRAEVAWLLFTGWVDDLSGWVPETGKPKLALVGAFGAVYPAGSAPPTGPPASLRSWPLARDIEMLPGGAGGYMLDGFGALHRFGSAPAPATSVYWPGWDIARDVVLRPAGGGYVLDGFGGLHPFGGAPVVSGGVYWHGWDIARKAAYINGYLYVMDAWGGIHATVGAPPITGGPWWNGWAIARDLRGAPGGVGGYLLDGYGGVWPVAGAPSLGATPYFGRDSAVGLVLRQEGGGYVAESTGRLTRFGAAPAVIQGRATYPGAEAISSPYAIRGVTLG